MVLDRGLAICLFEIKLVDIGTDAELKEECEQSGYDEA
jgi:hypothetical protein